ncbi:DUF2637 domain-containing protein [Streptomyces sp. NPDC005648]|uniref:DUF2637 domain-containing protein n=1 Tax=Streptomyces sp. NPDC005648 TaxID=3157044 RepID=UPI0033A86D27
MNRAEQLILGAAGVVTLAITVGAFTLSYEHLAWVAGEHGLGGSPVRQWMWPGCLDAFVIAGELLMLRASLVHQVDWWAVGLVGVGSGGSIALNVAGVGADAQALDYVVAAVPPVAALLAFGALARQVHSYLSGQADEEAPSALAPQSEEPAPPAERPRKPAKVAPVTPLVPTASTETTVSVLLASEPPEWASLSLREAVARADVIIPGQTASTLAAALSQVGVTATPGSIRSTRSALRRQKEKAS